MEQEYPHDYENEFDVPEYEYDFYDDFILEQQELEDFAQDGYFENMDFDY